MRLKISFLYVFLALSQISLGQIVFNELMIDPTPTVGLPDQEYVEIYNTSTQSISLLDWTISDLTSTRTFPDEVIGPNEYIIVVRNSNVALFQSFGRVVGLSSLPSLNNSGDTFTLRDDAGEVSDEISYTPSWYNDTSRDDGGYALERRNPDNFCDEAENWRASLATPGGSPGIENSIFDPDFFSTVPITVESSSITNTSEVTIIYSTKPDEASASNPSNYTLDNGLGNPQSVSVTLNDNTAKLDFSSAFQDNTIYQLSINNVLSCPLSSQVDTTVIFGIVDTPLRGELVINEILFNPKSGGVDYVELYNTTNKIFALDDLTVLEIDPETNDVVDLVDIDNTLKFILPDTYWVLTEDRSIVQEMYIVEHPSQLIDVNLPNYPDRMGTVAVLNASQDTIDILTYNEDWHYELITDNDGVALERLDASASSQNPQNWFSAAFTSGNGTPTSKNSQEGVPLSSEDGLILSAEIFTPDLDGMEDQLGIQLNVNNQEVAATIAVYNIRGNVVRTLLNNQLISAENSINLSVQR